jgi:hypothetical protein
MRRLAGPLFAMLLFSALAAQTVARVGNLDITADDVKIELADVDPRLPDGLREKTALDNLIRHALLELYANREKIEATDDEIEQYIRDDGESLLPVFTYGVFDEDKYAAIRDSAAFDDYFEGLRAELRLRKAGEMIRAGIELTDDDVQRAYIRDTYRIDLSYILIDKNTVAVPDSLTPEGAQNYYDAHRDEFANRPPYASLTYGRRYMSGSASSQKPLTTNALPVSTWRRILRDPAMIDRNDTSYIPDPSGKTDRDYSAKFTTRSSADDPSGFASVAQEVWKRYVDVRLRHRITDAELDAWIATHKAKLIAPARVCTVYCMNPGKLPLRENYSENELKNWYKDHIAQYRTSGKTLAYDAVRSRIIEDIKARERSETETVVRARMHEGIEGRGDLADLARRYDLVVRSDTVFVSRYANADSIDAAIAAELGSRDHGVVELNHVAAAWRAGSSLEALPSRAAMTDQARKLAEAELKSHSTITEGDLREFYNEISGDFTVPDSLSLAVAWFPARSDTTAISQQELDEAYEARRDRYWMDEGYSLEAFRVRDPGLRDWAEDCGRHHEAFSYGLPEILHAIGEFADGTPHRAADFPEPLRTALRELPTGICRYAYRAVEVTEHGNIQPSPARELSWQAQTTRPLRWDDGWLVASCFHRLHDEYAPFYMVRPALERDIHRERARALAHESANDFLSQAPDLSKTPAWAHIERLPRKDLTDDYPYVGDIGPYREALMKLNDGQALKQVISCDSGYVILYLASRNRVKPTAYRDLKPFLRGAYTERERDRNARAFLNGLVSRLREGDKPEEMLPLFGDWRSLTNLTPEDSLAGVPNSARILADLRNRRAGEYMPPVRITRDRFMLVRVDRIQKGGRDDFEQRRDAVREQLLQHRFLRWMADFERQSGVVRY